MTEAFKKRKPKDVLFGNDLTIEWRDGLVCHYPFISLRDACPCAECVDEITGEKVLDSSSIPSDVHIEKAEYVGNYALRFDWSDGHDSGIYAFRFLREFFDLAQELGGYEGGPYSYGN